MEAAGLAGVLYFSVAKLLPLYRADLGFSIVGPKFAALIGIAAAAYLLPCYLLDLHEARAFMRKLKEQMLRPLNLT